MVNQVPLRVPEEIGENLSEPCRSQKTDVLRKQEHVGFPPVLLVEVSLAPVTTLVSSEL